MTVLNHVFVSGHGSTMQSNQNFMLWGHAVLVRENRAFKYFFISGTLPIAVMMPASTAFWSDFRAAGISFFSFSCWKKPSSPLLFFFSASRLKYASLNLDTSIFPKSTLVL